MIINDREESRRIFYQVWEKYLNSKPMQPLESLISSIIEAHPQYHEILNTFNSSQNDVDSEKQNSMAFLHMGLHIALQESLATDRPAGITSIYRTMLGKCPDEHAIQHRFMECLEEVLWQSQRDGRMPDEQEYLDSVRRIKP